MDEKIKKRLFIFLFILLLAPFIQKNLPFIESKRLNGDFTNAGDVDFTWKTWFDGSYRDNKSKYHNDQCGFRRDLVRINNQLDYWLFEKLHSFYIVIGKEDCLYQEAYITSYYGEDFLGNDTLRKLYVKLRAVQDTLTKQGKGFVLVYEPTKAYYYPENFPDRLKKRYNPSNVEVCTRLGDSLHINQIDFNSWFVSMKNKHKDSIFSKQGIHWTTYGATLAADSMVKYISALTGKKLPQLVYGNIERTQDARDPDKDIYDALNLIFPIVKETFSYPFVDYKRDSATKKPKAVYIGDSFFMNMVRYQIPNNINSDWEFWFYFKLIVRENSGDDPANWKSVDGYDWGGKIDSSDYIVLMYTAHNLSNPGFSSFIEKAYDRYYPAK